MDSFNPHEVHCNLIEYMLQGFVLFASSNLNPLEIFMYISLSMDLYRYVLITYVRCTSNLLEIVRGTFVQMPICLQQAL